MVLASAEVLLYYLTCFFVDDNILFARASPQECSDVTDIISTYKRASGQKVNIQKLEVAFSKNVSHNSRLEILQVLQMREVDRHEKYTGLPTIIGRSKKTVFVGLKERV